MKRVIVASFTDAWIETTLLLMVIIRELVASFTDAWIETTNLLYIIENRRSHLLQMRGLKLR